MEKYIFAGGPAEAGRAQGALDPEYARRELEKRLELRQDFKDSYFRENMAFMRREFPELVTQMEAYGEAAGIENFDHTFLLHVYFTAADLDGCSALGIMLKDDGPAMLRTYDTSSIGRVEDFVNDKILMGLPDGRPHGLAGIGERFGVTVGTAINDAGLLVGCASGHRKYSPGANPEHVNLYFTTHLIAQYCTNCGDVRHFLRQYRISGIKGLTGVAVDASGDMVGFELESENIALRGPENGMVLETNHWQDPDLQRPSRKADPDWWASASFYNSQNRVQYLACHRDAFKKMRTVNKLTDFSLDVHAPGRFLQSPETNIGGWFTTHAVFMTSRDRKLRVHRYPLERERFTVMTYVE